MERYNRYDRAMFTGGPKTKPELQQEIEYEEKEGMSMKSKKITAILMAAAMMTGMLSGLAVSADETETETAAAEETATSANFPLTEEKKEFSIMIPGSATKNAETCYNNQAYEEMTNVHINWIVVPSESWADKVSVTMASGDLPDVIAGMDTYNMTATQEAQYAGQGYLTPLNDLIEENMPNFSALMANDPQIEKLISQNDGTIYSMPGINECYHCNYSQKMYINKTWLDNLGLEMPTTIDEYYEVLKAFKEQDANGNGDPDDEIPLITAANGWHVQLDGFLMNAFTYCDADTHLAVEDGKLINTATTEEYRKGLEFLHKLYDEGLLSQESFTNDTDTNTKINVSNEDYALFGSFPAAYQMYTGDTELYKEYEILPPLAGDGVEPQTPNYSLTRDVIRGNFVITSAAEDPALILHWLDYFYSEEGEMFRTGREGIEWEKAEEGQTGFNGEPAKYVSLSTPEDDEYYQNVDFSESIPALISKEHRESAATSQDFRGEGVNNWNEVQLFQGTQNYEAVARSAEESLPPLTVPAEKADDYARMKTELEDYMDECMVQFIVGGMDLENDWDGYLDQLNAIGMEEYMTINNEAYQDYLNR